MDILQKLLAKNAHEIIQSILLYLDFKSLHDNRTVCKKWNEMIQNFYGDFHLTVRNVIGTAQKALGERNLGVDPVSGKNVFVRIGPFGPMVQLGEKQEDENAPKPKFASLLN